MAHALPTKLSSSIGLANSGQLNGSNKSKRLPATMLCSSRSACMKLSSFSGMRRANSVDSLLHRSEHTLLSRVAAATTLNRRGRNSRMVPRAMFERFTEKSIKVIMLSQEEARLLGHNSVGTEQLLLGLIGEGTELGINLKDARNEVEKMIGRGSGFVDVDIPFTPGAKCVLQHSLEEARQLGHNDVAPEHLLLGLLREKEGVAARVLENLGADSSNIRTQVIRMIEPATVGVGGDGSFSANLTKLAEEEGEKAITLDMDRREFEERLKKLVDEAERLKKLVDEENKKTFSIFLISIPILLIFLFPILRINLTK